MREIKFRVWDKLHKEWLGADAWFVHSSTSVLVVWPEVKKGFEVSVHMETLGRDRVELMQYTGLHDKNGVEIYEGDLVLMNPLHKTPHEIRWYQGAFVAYSPNINHTIFEYGDNLEVIGNIWENGDLLNDKSN